MARARTLVALALAVAAGLVEGALRTDLPMRLRAAPASGLGLAEVGLVVSALALLSLALLAGLFGLGYRRPGRPAGSSAPGRFGLNLLGAAMLGFGVGYLAIVLALPRPPGAEPGLATLASDGASAANDLVRVPFAALAGVAIGRYRRAAPRPPGLVRDGDDATLPFALALALAGLDGVLAGLGPSLPPLVTAGVTGPSLDQVLAALLVLDVVGLGTTLLLFVVGFWWALEADVPASFGRFAVVLLAAALVGLALGLLPLALAAERSVTTAVSLFGGLSLSTVFVPLAALAGGVLARPDVGSTLRGAPSRGGR